MIKKLTCVVGAVLLLVGVLGFFNDPVLGLFAVNAAHNVIHIVTGIALLLLAAKGGSTLSTGLIVLGVVYALVTVLGFAMGDGLLLGLVEVDHADHFLHLAAALVFLGMGFGARGSTA